MAIRKAMLLAAGRGSRLGAHTAATPKPLLEVAGRPLIAHIVEGLVAAGLHEYVIIVGYLGEQIEDWCGAFAATRPGITMHAVRQRALNGTGGAILEARPLIEAGERFIFGWGDILMDAANYPRFVAQAEAGDQELLLAVNRVDDPWRGAAAYLDAKMRVTRIVEKPERGTSATNWNNAGLFAASMSLFDYAGRLTPSSRGELELPQAIAAMIADGRDVRAFEVQGFCSDVGTPEDLGVARKHFALL